LVLVLVLELKLLLTNHLHWCARRMFACLLLSFKKKTKKVATYVHIAKGRGFVSHTHTQRERERERWTYTV
jgi:hypothetical protein